MKGITSLGALALVTSLLPAHAQSNATVFDDPGTAVGSFPAEGALASSPSAGFNLQRAIFRLDPVADTLDIRLKFDGIAGDADGNGDPNGGPDDVANFGAGESFGVLVDLDCDGSDDFIIGLPTNSALTGAGNEPLLVRDTTSANPPGEGFGNTNFPGLSAVLVHAPSSADPDLLIRVANWSQSGRNSEQFVATIFAESQTSGRNVDAMLARVNLNFSGRASFRASDPINDVGIAPQSTNPSTGWDLTTTNFFYDPVTDIMKVVQKFNGVAGDADGDGVPGNWSLPTAGQDVPNLGGSESIAIAFDFDEDGNFDTVVGVPGESNAPNFYDNFIDPADLSIPVADFDGDLSNLGASFGNPTTTGATASLAHNPSAAEPDFVVNIENWSELTITPFQFGYRAFSGSFADGGFGEDNQSNTIALEAQLRDRKESFSDILDVGVPPGNPTFSGWDFTALNFSYNPISDKLKIFLDFAVIAGDADGNGDPGAMAPGVSGTDSPDIGNGETISVLLDLDSDGTEDIVVGVPRNEALDTATLRLKLSAYDASGGLGLNFGADDTSGATAFASANPSAANPDFEITIHGWSLLDTQDPHLFGLRAFAGSFVDAGFGEDHIPNPGVPPLVTELDFTLITEDIFHDPTTGETTICFQGGEMKEHQIQKLGEDLNGSTLLNVSELMDLLDGKMETDGTIETDFTGNAEVRFGDPASPLKAFYRVAEFAPTS